MKREHEIDGKKISICGVYENNSELPDEVPDNGEIVLWYDNEDGSELWNQTYKLVPVSNIEKYKKE